MSSDILRQIESRLSKLEQDILDHEQQYIEETEYGNFVKGYGGFAHYRFGGAPRRCKIRRADRLFSLSSTTAAIPELAESISLSSHLGHAVHGSPLLSNAVLPPPEPDHVTLPAGAVMPAARKTKGVQPGISKPQHSKQPGVGSGSSSASGNGSRRGSRFGSTTGAQVAARQISIESAGDVSQSESIEGLGGTAQAGLTGAAAPVSRGGVGSTHTNANRGVLLKRPPVTGGPSLRTRAAGHKAAGEQVEALGAELGTSRGLELRSQPMNLKAQSINLNSSMDDHSSGLSHTGLPHTSLPHAGLSHGGLRVQPMLPQVQHHAPGVADQHSNGPAGESGSGGNQRRARTASIRARESITASLHAFDRTSTVHSSGQASLGGQSSPNLPSFSSPASVGDVHLASDSLPVSDLLGAGQVGANAGHVGSNAGSMTTRGSTRDAHGQSQLQSAGSNDGNAANRAAHPRRARPVGFRS